jgi:hypothetical protein
MSWVFSLAGTSRISTSLSPTFPLTPGLVPTVNSSSWTGRMAAPCGRAVELLMTKTMSTSRSSTCYAQDVVASVPAIATADALDASQEAVDAASAAAATAART